jgi:hypothetical protein
MLSMDFYNLYSVCEREDRAMCLLELVDMAAYAHKLPGEIMGEERH